MSPYTYIVVDASKFSAQLGAKFSVPIEVIPDAASLVTSRLSVMGCREHSLRKNSGSDGPAYTKYGNWIIDAKFEPANKEIHAELKSLPGVVETGIFSGFRTNIIRA